MGVFCWRDLCKLLQQQFCLCLDALELLFIISFALLLCSKVLPQVWVLVLLGGCKRLVVADRFFEVFDETDLRGGVLAPVSVDLVNFVKLDQL